MTTATTAQGFDTAMRAALGRAGINRLGLAVSGGGDSMALLHLAHEWALARAGQSGRAGRAITLCAATVNHGLRDAAVAEAQMVADTCAELEITHATLPWNDWLGRGNLQDAARHARYDLLAEWARENAVDTIALGHTKDDQAETFLMRLARGSGVDGLALMRADWQDEGQAGRRAGGQADTLRWLRPLRHLRRQELRDYLTANARRWVDDPTNEDRRFDRVKARQALEILAPLGIDAARLGDTARNMDMARDALRHYAHEAAHEFCRVSAGDVVIKADMARLPDETIYRLFSSALMWVSGAQYRPRFQALVDTCAAVFDGDRRTLHGCVLSRNDDEVRITREYQSVKDEVQRVGQLWDKRWQVSASGPEVQAGSSPEIRALGDAIKSCPNWRETGLPRSSLMASPAVWQGAELIAAPLAGLGHGYAAKIDPNQIDFFTSVLSH